MIAKLNWTKQTATGDKRMSARSSIGFVFGLVLAIFVASAPSAYAVVVTDDFSDLNDTANPTWTRLDGAAASTLQTWDASAGQYHLTAPANGTHPLFPGYSFVGSYTGPSFTDVRVSTDFVDFTPTDFEGSIIGVAARLNGDNRSWANPADPMQGLHGYGYMYEANANNGNGEVVLALLWAAGYKDIGSQKVTLDNNKDYRFVLEVIGNALHGQVFELDGSGNVLQMVAEDFRDVIVEPVMIDHDLNGDDNDVPHVPYTSGFSGVWGVGHVFYRDADFTVDNFRTETALAGDYDRNGVVDMADYEVWRSTFNESGPVGNPPTAFGDLRANGAVANRNFGQKIEAADYTVWQDNLGAMVSPGVGSGAIPEPTSVALVLVGIVSLMLGRRRFCR